MVVGYAVTGENLWGVRPDGQVELKTTPEFDQVMGGNAAFPPMLTKVGDSGLVQALVAALHPDPYQRDRVEISRALPPTPSVRLAQHEAENVRLGLVIKTTTAEAQAIARQAEIDAARSRLLETEVDRLGSTLEERAAEAAAARSELEAVRANAAAEAQRWDAALRAAQGASGAAGATPPVPGSRSRRVRRLLLGGLAAIACIVLAVSLLVWGGADSSQPASASGGTRTVVSDQGQRLRIARTGAPSPANDRSRSAARRTSGGWKGSSLQSRPLAGTDDAGHFAQTAGPAGRCSLEEGGDNYPLVVPVGEDLLTVVEHGDERDLVRRTSAGGRRWTRAVKRSACDGIFSAGGLGLVRGVQDAGDLTALDVSTGRTVWSVTLASAEEGDRVVRPVDADHGEVLLIGTHFVAKLELADGRARWMADVADGRSVCEAGLAGEVVWVTTCGGAVLQLDSKTGDQVGAVHHVGDHEAGLAVSPEGIAYVFGTARVDGVWVQAQSFGLDGRRRWERDVKLEGQYLAHAVAPGGALYLSRQYGTKAKVVELRRQSGNVRDVFGVDGGTAQPIAYDLATAMDGTVAIVDTWAFDDGRFTWKVCNLTRTTDPSAGWIYDPKGCTAEREGWRKISRGTDGALWAIGPDGERAGRL
jgi:outer membrane protein assembly factor BamB